MIDYHYHADGAMQILLRTEQDIAEFKALLDRALNTWDTAPAWMFKLADELSGVPSGPVKGMRDGQ